MSPFKLLINGNLIDGAGTLDVINPATGEVFQTCPRADTHQLNLAVAAAKQAFPAWAQLETSQRRESILEIAAAMEARHQELATLLTMEQGKPLTDALAEVAGAMRVLRTMASFELTDQVLHEDANTVITQSRRPLGVVAAIVPWNFPLALLASKLAPALLTGNTLIIKPAPSTPLTTLRLGEIFANRLPPGVVNIITDANDLGDTLTCHPDVAKISFTGSTATGRKVMANAASRIKRLTLELGGNDAALVLDDAPVQETARLIFAGAMRNAGQFCAAIKRVYVPEQTLADFCSALAHYANQVVMGDGLREGVNFGPVQNRTQYERLLELLNECQLEGTVVAGGEPLDRPGFFIPPTIVCRVTDNARIVREEQFGPILPILTYTDIDDAISRINHSEYGLGASVWGADLSRAQTIAQRLEAGTVWINKSGELSPLVPFRGMKQSGLGTELGMEGLEEFTQARVMSVRLA